MTLNAIPEVFHPDIHTDFGGGVDKNRQRKRIFCFSARVLPCLLHGLWEWRQWAPGQTQHFSIGSGQGWGESILHPTLCPHQLISALGMLRGSDTALLNNQNVRVVHSDPPQGAALQMLPLKQSSSSSPSVPHSALMLQLISHFPCVSYCRTSLIIFHFVPGKCIEHDVRT